MFLPYRNKKIAGHALYFSIIIALVVALLCSSVILYAFLSKSIQNKYNSTTLLANNIASGIALTLSQEEKISGHLDLFENGTNTITVKNETWGAFDLAIIEGSNRNDTLNKSFFYGYQLKGSNRCLYLCDMNRPLSLCGNTVIKGDSYLPKAGLKRAYIEGKSFNKRKLIDGTSLISKSEIPALNNKIITELKSPTNNSIILTFGDSTTIYQSFNKPSIHLTESNMDLHGQSYFGKIILGAKNEITIHANTQLENVILRARKIIIKNGFRGNLQAFATDTIIVEDDVQIR